VLEIADTGKPFDVLSLPEPDITLDIKDRQVGGLGIHFIRTLSDGVSYRRENGRNILRMVFKRTEDCLP
jgi:anti-sigma regulatory factor (Ser/Thr protein kinase)